MTTMFRHLALPAMLVCFGATGANAQDTMKKMDTMKSEAAVADCIKKAKMEKDSAKMAMMEKACTSNASMSGSSSMKK